MLSISKTLKQLLFPKIAVLLLLSALLIIGAVPGYMGGKWEWKQPPPIATIRQLRQLYQTGLEIPGWRTLEKNVGPIGQQRWVLQKIQSQSDKTPVLLQLLPQNDERKQPQVEWVDIDSYMGWKVAQFRHVEFTVSPTSEQPFIVQARFFRGATKTETFAVLQWYAWQGNGNPSPLKWFIVDQAAQLRKQRVPWTAVSIIVPMEQLGQSDREWEKVKSLGEKVQLALMDGKL